MALSTRSFHYFLSANLSHSRFRSPSPSSPPISNSFSVPPFPSIKHLNHGASNQSPRRDSDSRLDYPGDRRRIRPVRSEFSKDEGCSTESEDENAISQLEPRPNLGDFANSGGVVSACFIGVLTGVSVVFFNNAVHEIRDFFWDDIPYRGVSWLREESLEVTWKWVVLVPVCGGLIVSILNLLQGFMDGYLTGLSLFNVKDTLQPIYKAIAACFTLGTGNSLGPEGPSVEIGASIAKGVSSLVDRRGDRKLSFVAAGSAAGLSAGFNAAFAGCFFAVESVLWPSTGNSSTTLTNATPMVILSAVIASVLSEIGLGSEPAFKVPEYDFRSPSELPLYLLLGLLCGVVSLTLSRCTSCMFGIFGNPHNATGIQKAIFPVLGGLIVGLIALAYPEILYWGFENVDVLLESHQPLKGLSIDLLLQLVAFKIVATSACRASGLVGGYYAPSLFIGAATGMAYGKILNLLISQGNPTFHNYFLEVASPQAYGLVGMAATLAGVCQVPLTAVLLLFELTQDYRIVLPLLGAVGLSSWITSGQSKKMSVLKSEKLGTAMDKQPELQTCSAFSQFSASPVAVKASSANDICVVENALSLDDSRIRTDVLEKQIYVSQAMRTRYVTILMSTSLMQAVSLMLEEKQSCAIIVDEEHMLIGLLTLDDIQSYTNSRNSNQRTEAFVVSDICSSYYETCQVSVAATPSMSLFSARMIMTRHEISQLPVVSEHAEDHKGHLVGLLDIECISLACRALATKECLTLVSTTK